MRSRALIAAQPRAELTAWENEIPDAPADGAVRVRVRFCGICHTDVHEIDNDWDQPDSFYPFIPGHEIIGEVTAIGASVRSLAIGDVVGIGWQQDACGECFACSRGWRNVCVSMTPTYAARNGGFQQYVSVPQDFALKMPEALRTAEAAPLLCGGIAVFNPLVLYDVQPWMRTAVMGFGGLGHLALQFMSRWGCDTTVITRDSAKERAARDLGSRDFFSSLADVPQRSFDFLMVTGPVTFDVDAALKTLRARGKLCIIGGISGHMPFSTFELLNNETAICSGSIGDPVTIARMLEFAAANDVRAKVTAVEPGNANAAVSALREGRMPFRAVLDLQSL